MMMMTAEWALSGLGSVFGWDRRARCGGGDGAVRCRVGNCEGVDRETEGVQNGRASTKWFLSAPWALDMNVLYPFVF